MKAIKVYNKCIMVEANSILARRYPFAQFVMIKNPYNQIGIGLEQSSASKAIRLDGWDYTNEDNLIIMLDALLLFAGKNGYSRIYYLDRISDERAMPLEEYGFIETDGGMYARQFELEVDPI